MSHTDQNQQIFEEFTVPDAVRIRKSLELVKDYFHGEISKLCLLECGAARGGVANALCGKIARCCGVDIHPRNIEGVEMRQMDLNDGLPDFGVYFDVIFAGEVMEHLFDDVKFIKNCRERLTDGGLLVITVPNLLFILNRIRMLFGGMPVFFAYAPYHYRFYGKKTLRKILEDNGFEVIKTRSSHILFSTRRSKIGKIFELLGDVFPSIGAHLIISAKKTTD